jgi:hypothetical protein
MKCLLQGKDRENGLSREISLMVNSSYPQRSKGKLGHTKTKRDSSLGHKGKLRPLL